MSTKIDKLLIEIVRLVAVDDDIKKASQLVLGLSDYELKDLFKLASLHQVNHFIAYVMITIGDKRFEKFFYSSAGLVTKQQVAIGEISRNLSDNKIHHIMLKGVVMRKLYLEPWMRNSCDIDVLVRAEDLKAAEDILTNLGYKKRVGIKGMSAHDIQFDKNSIHVELHFALIAENLYPKLNAILCSVWDSCTIANESEYVMSDDFFYFYHIAHMMKHFENGGFGVRPVLDLWLLNNKCKFSRVNRHKLLSLAGLSKFESEMRRLSEYWFGDGDGEGLESIIEFVLSGGAYGTIQNSVLLKRAKCGGRVLYFWSRIFVPYSLLRRYYPVLNKYPILLPFFEVKRWIDALRRDKSKYLKEFRENIRDNDEQKKMNEMLKSLGLKEQ